MKKFLVLVITITIMSLCGCGTNNTNTSGETTDSDSTASVNVSQNESQKDEVSIETSEIQTNNNSSETENSTVINSNHTQNQTVDSNASAKENTTQSPTGSTNNEVANNTPSSEKSPVTETPVDKSPSDDAPANDTPSADAPADESNDTPLGEVEEGLVCYEYELNGTITDWFTENDLVYATFKNVNRFVILDTKTGQVIVDKALGGRPAEIHNFGDELWISYPDLQCIKIHDKETFSVKSSIYLQHSVSSFDTYGDYLIYTEDDQHVRAYRYNLKTGENVNIKPDNAYSFYEADVLVNSEQGLVYIGESNSTGSVLFCFDIETLELKSQYKKNDYGYGNKKRRIFLSDGFLYWGEFRINPLNVSQIDAQYTGEYSAGMLHVDDIFVATTNGIYLKDTCEQLASGNFGQFYSSIAITESGNIMVTDHEKLYIISQNI